MKYSVIFFIFLLQSFYSFAQQPDSSSTLPANGKITGSILDSLSNTPVEYALVSLIDEASNKPVDGAMCDEKGEFTITGVKAGSYRLLISFLGYKSYTSEPFSISEKTNRIEFDPIILATEIKKADEVVIEAKRDLIEEKVDRTVYNAEIDPTNKGGDATDVLRKVPMLSVDLDGNVSLRGTQNIKVLINNRPSTITAGSVADALKQIPSDQIKSVEVITSPSAKYDSEGSGGIINIITKKSNQEGFSLGVDASAGVRGSSLGLNGSYRKGKMGFTLGGYGRAGYNIKGRFENDQATTASDGTVTRNMQSADTWNERLFGNYSLGWDYDINKNNYLTAGAKYSFRNNNNYQDNLRTLNYVNDTLRGEGIRNADALNSSGSWDLNVGYTHLFKKPQQEFSLLALYSRDDRTNNFTNTILDSTDESTVTERLKNRNKSFNKEITVQADFQSPLGKSQMLELGAKNINRKVTSDYTFFSAAGADGPFIESQNNSRNNALDYNQNVTAGYLSYMLSFLKSYSLKAGVRYEHTYIDASLQSGQKISIPSYGFIVPSINISKKFKNGNMLKASFNQRVQRPSLQFLNPNLQASNPLNVTIGNPLLRPEYTNNFELSYSAFIKTSSFTLAGFVRTTDNAIQSVRDIIGDTIRTTYQNIGQESAYGFNFHTGLNISGKFTLNGGTDVYYAVLKNNVPDPLYSASNQGWVASYRLTGTYYFTKTLAFQLFGFYRARQVNLQGYQGGFGTYSLSIKKDFAGKKGSIGFGAENFFTKAIYITSQQESPVLTQASRNIMYNMNFKINFSYRFGKLSGEEKRKRRKSINNDDMKEESGNNDGGGNTNTPPPSTPQKK